jgi:hypothetical protein
MTARSRFEAHGISMLVPTGWEARFSRPASRLDDGGTAHPYLHAANFALPAARAPFGSGVVGDLRASDVFVALLEYAPASAATPLFSSRGVPVRLQAGDFSASALQRSRRGQTGFQRFFHESGRAFCLYVVLGGRPAYERGLASVNSLLWSMRIRAVTAVR